MISESVEEKYARIPKMNMDVETLSYKTLVDEFVLSDIRADRSLEKEIVDENGRHYWKQGTRCATTVVGLLYKMDNVPSVKPLDRYVLAVGLARQNPIDIKVSVAEGIEVAYENAQTNPVMTIHCENPISEEAFKAIAKAWATNLRDEFVMLRKERNKTLADRLEKEWASVITARKVANTFVA